MLPLASPRRYLRQRCGCSAQADKTAGARAFSLPPNTGMQLVAVLRHSGPVRPLLRAVLFRTAGARASASSLVPQLTFGLSYAAYASPSESGASPSPVLRPTVYERVELECREPNGDFIDRDVGAVSAVSCQTFVTVRCKCLSELLTSVF